jgi:hypothetical protein
MSILARAVQTTANTEQTLYTVPASTEALCTISVCNRGAIAATVRVALGASGDTAGQISGFIEYDVSIPPNGVLERNGILLSADEKIFVNSNTATAISYVVIGKTDAA